MQRRLTICFSLLVAIIFTSSFRGTGPHGTISLNFSNAPLEKVLASIERQSDYRFIYSDEAAAACTSLSIRLRDADIKKIMDACLKGQPLTYSVDENYVVLRKL